MSDHDASSPTSSGTPQSNGSERLTPRRKVQALLARFGGLDSDSDSTSESRSPTIAASKGKRDASRTTDVVGDATEDTQPRSRIAARLLNDAQTENSDTEGAQSHDPTTSRVDEAGEGIPHLAANISSDEDEIATAVARRRYLVKTTQNPRDDSEVPPESRIRSASGLFSSPISSANHSPRVSSALNGAEGSSTDTADHGRSKFLALVDKHRKERLAKEAAEAAKRDLAIEEQPEDTPSRRGPRGSSPADDSEEDGDSDHGAAQRISRESRPTRKASKKALEEMNRETQRMNRNMQLAHQAKTKKKITKESLLARFNFVDSGTTHEPAGHDKSSDVSSAAESDSERFQRHDTPPTSPLHEPERDDNTKTAEGKATYQMLGALMDDGLSQDAESSSILKSVAGYQKIQQYIANDRTVLSPDPESLEAQISFASVPRNPNTAIKNRSILSKVLPAAMSDSDSEIDIIQEKGSRRKYAAFESLPKRKAKEAPSHLALRSLAHLMGGDDKKLGINAAQMEFSLRKKARMQAQEERKQKIEELKARGIVIQSAEERERDQQEVEDLVERARQEAADIQKREKEIAKKDGTYVKDQLDDDEDDSDEDFEDDLDAEDDERDGSESDDEEQHNDGGAEQRLIDDEVDEADSEGSDGENEETDVDDSVPEPRHAIHQTPLAASRVSRKSRIVSDDEDEDESGGGNKENQSPATLASSKTPQSLSRSARKVIPGLHMSDDLPMGLSQAFAATMAESDDEEEQPQARPQDQDSFGMTADLPSPNIQRVVPLQRMDSVDMISDSQPATQTQPLNVRLDFSQSQAVPESPSNALGISIPQYTPSQRPFDLTQDGGYVLSPFSGSRFAETPSRNVPHSTIETLILPAGIDVAESPIVSRRGKLRRGRALDDDDEAEEQDTNSAFQVMKRAAVNKAARDIFDKSKSDARQHFDEAAEESEDEYAGLGGASDEDPDEEENEEDRRMIDEDTQVGVGDEARLAGFYADRERERDEKDVSKLLKDITTGALRRKRGVGDDLDLSDEEDAVARRREAKRREFARMRRELLKDEAVGKIAEDKKKEAFLRSIEDREEVDDDNDVEETTETESQDQSQGPSPAIDGDVVIADSQEDPQTRPRKAKPLDHATDSKINRQPASLRRTNVNINRKPSNLAEIRDSVSFLIEEPESQASLIDLGLSDSEDEPEAYVNLDRHLRDAENDENMLNDDDAEDLGDFIVDDDNGDKNGPLAEFKKPDLPLKDRAPFSERRTKREDVVDRLSLLRQASSSSSNSSVGSNISSKMAFFSGKHGGISGSANGVPSLLRRATTNSSLGSMSGRENVSATGVTTSNGAASRTERGDALSEKEFIRKGSAGRRNAVNFQARTTLKEEKMSQRAGIAKASARAKNKKAGGNGFLNGLFRGDSWS